MNGMREHIANPDITVVALPEARRDELLDIDQWAFASAEESLDPDLSLLGFEWERTFGAEINGALSGVNSVYSLRMPVPGGEVPAAGLTSVGVHPQYRRRGVLSAMIAASLQGSAGPAPRWRGVAAPVGARRLGAGGRLRTDPADGKLDRHRTPRHGQRHGGGGTGTQQHPRCSGDA